jgi:hypothetical protein
MAVVHIARPPVAPRSHARTMTIEQLVEEFVPLHVRFRAVAIDEFFV